MKEFDNPRTLEDLLAEKAAKDILSVGLFAEDFDDACNMGGAKFYQEIATLVESAAFQLKIKKIIGSRFNEEFFLDGYRGEQ